MKRGVVFGVLLGLAGVLIALDLRAENEAYWFIPLILIPLGLVIAVRGPRRPRPSRHGRAYDERTAGGDVCDASDGCGDGGD